MRLEMVECLFGDKYQKSSMCCALNLKNGGCFCVLGNVFGFVMKSNRKFTIFNLEITIF